MYVELKEQDYGGAYHYFLIFSQCQISKMQRLLMQHAQIPLQLKYFIFICIYLHSIEPYKGHKQPNRMLKQYVCVYTHTHTHTIEGQKTHKTKAPIIH